MSLKSAQRFDIMDMRWKAVLQCRAGGGKQSSRMVLGWSNTIKQCNLNEYIKQDLLLID